MNPSQILVVRPIHPQDERAEDPDEAYDVCETEQEFIIRHDAFVGLCEYLKTKGFTRRSDTNDRWGASEAQLGGCNWKGTASVELMHISPDKLAVLIGEFQEYAKTRKAALAKLSREERAVLGVQLTMQEEFDLEEPMGPMPDNFKK